MTPNLRFARRTAAVCLFVSGLIVAAPTIAAQTPQDASSSKGPSAAGAQHPWVLPSELLPVPGKVVELGSTAKELLETEAKVNPLSDDSRVSDLPRLYSELGKTTVQVEPFLLGKHLITMEQYKIFVEKTGHRFPFDWWRYGREDDFEKRREQINKEIKQNENKHLLYWQAHWKELPWAIPVDKDERGKPSMDRYPVVFVSWRDAVAFAGWAGMRLPAEAEWNLAASGGERREFVWGDDVDGLGLQRGSRNDKPWPVGKWGEKARGPFGHEDLVLHVWEWTQDPGFFSFVDSKEFTKEREKLLSDKMFKDTDSKPVQSARQYWPDWSGSDRVCKGGSYASERAELRISTRANMGSHQTLGRLGFRVAKSLEPARDIAASWIGLDYDYSCFGGDRKPNLGDQVGIERYDLTDGGRLIAGYYAVSLVPANMTSEDRKASLQKLGEDSQERPIALATLVVTVKLEKPELDTGIYTLCYRKSGMPRVLTQALATAKKELRTLARERAKAEKTGKPIEDKPADESKDETWRPVLKKFGITDEEAEAGDVDFVRLMPGAIQVSTDEDSYLFRNKEGTYVASMRATADFSIKGGYGNGDAAVQVEPMSDGRESVLFDFGVPLTPKNRSAVKIKLKVTLPAESAGGARWRTPDSPVQAVQAGDTKTKTVGSADQNPGTDARTGSAGASSNKQRDK